MLLRILLITSIAIVTNDRRRRFQKRSVAISLSKHLGIAVTGLLIPTALSMTTTPNSSDFNKQSRGVSILYLILYGLYLYSEWRTYALLGFQSEQAAKEATEAREARERAEKGIVLSKGLAFVGYNGAAIGVSLPTPPSQPPPQPPPQTDFLMNPNALEEAENDVQRKPQLHFWISIPMLILMGALLALHILFISDSIEGISKDRGISQEFIGLIMLPILGVDSTLLHLDNRYDSEEATRTTLGLGLQTLLFMTPLLVLVSWIAGIEDMNLVFNPFEVTVLFPAVLVVQASIEETENGW